MKRRTLLLGVGGAAVAAAGGAGAWRSATGSMTDYAAYQAELRAALKPDVKDLIRYSTLAANSHNTQPWNYRISDGAIDLLPDFARRTPIVDPDDHHLFISLGCAAENLALAASAAGMSGEFAAGAPENNGLRFAYSKGQSQASPLFDAIGTRQSTRSLYNSRSVPADELGGIEHASAMDGVSLVLITDEEKRSRMRDLVIAANSQQMADPAFIKELRDWLRFNPKSAMASGDGLFSAASGNPVMPDLIAGVVLDFALTAASENEKYRRQIDSSAGLAVFFAAKADPEHWIKVGRACQRFGLPRPPPD